MSDGGLVSQRFVRRLAEGVYRARLVDPVVASRPPLVLVSGPSGYGKTVFAAQLAVAGAFTDVAWIRSQGAIASVSDALLPIAEHLTGGPLPPEAHALPELCHICSHELAALPDGHQLLIVVDDAPWVGDLDSFRILENVIAEAPVGTSVVVTTRIDLRQLPHLAGAWSISSGQLMLTDEEIVELWAKHTGRPLGAKQAEEVAVATKRHTALASLMARHAALADREITSVEASPSVSALLQSLVVDQLGASDRRLLDYAAVLGQGTDEALRRAAASEDVRSGLARLAAALPLVSVSERGVERWFAVHDLVGSVCNSVGWIAANEADGLGRVVDELARSGAVSRALEVSVESGSADVIASALRRFGGHLLKGASWETVRQAMSLVPTEAIASDPSLLIVKAELAWVEGSRNDAVKQAMLAVRLGELSGAGAVPPAARSLLAGMRMAATDFEGAASDVAPLLSGAETATPDELADVLYAAIPAHAFIGDRAGLERCRAAARRLIATEAATSSRLARLEGAMGIVADIADGDHLASLEMLRDAAARRDVPQHWRAVTLGNSAAAAIEAGDVEYAATVNLEAATIGSSYSTPLDRALLTLTDSVGLAMRGERRSIRGQLDRVLALCEAEQVEAFTLATACSIGAQCALALGEVDYGQAVSERGLRASADTGSPVLLWLAELVQAQASLALGDVERAESSALRILPRAESVQSRGQVLRAELILAVASLRRADLARAVEHISHCAEYIGACSPVLVLWSYLRLFPGLLGPLVLAMGLERVPERLLPLLRGPRAKLALESASSVLSPDEVEQLRARMHLDAEVSSVNTAEPEPAVICRVRLFGGLEVVTPKGKVGDRDWTKRKARLLFAMLVARFGTDVPRGEIVEYLWPEMDEERSLNNFYVVWSAMKRALTPGSVRDTPSPFVEHTHGVCRIVRDHVVSDLDEFRDLLADARRAREIGDADKEVAALRAAEALYRGDVLPGDVYDDWFASVRDRYRHDFEDAMLRLAQLYLDRDEPHDGLAVLRKVTSPEMWREDLFQALLRLQIAAGQRSAAIETYMLCRARLTEDLGIDPSRETTALYEQILGMEEGVGRTADGYGTADDGTLVRKR